MARKSTRTRRKFVPPRLIPSESSIAERAQGQPSEALWALGEQAEEDFDYEGARGWYREATRAAPSHEAAALAGRYARFLVERYGQYPEVAAWLDDEDFDPLADSEGRALPELAHLVALSAHEVDHPRSAALDEALARTRGEPNALARVALGLATEGATQEAIALLLEHRDGLPALCEARSLLEQLLEAQDAECEAALSAVSEALQTRNPEAAAEALKTVPNVWRDHPRYQSAEAEIEALRGELQAESLRRAIESALDRDELTLARDAARQLVTLRPESEGDAHTLAWLDDQIAKREQALLLKRLEEETDPLSRVRLLIHLFQTFGANLEIPEGDTATWSIVRQAQAQSLLRDDPGPHILTCVALQQACAADRLQELDGLLQTLPDLWERMSPVKTARETQKTAKRQAEKAQQEAFLAEIQRHIDAGDLDSAQEGLLQQAKLPGGRSPASRALAKEIERRRLNVARREGLLTKARAQLESGELFTATRRINELESEGAAPEIIAELRTALEAGRDEALRAAPVPPFNLKVERGPIATGISDGRLVIVQGRLWLSINLETRGLQPFMLPEGWPLSERPKARMMQVGDRLVLIGFSRGRLMRIEQRPGEPPEVKNARILKELVRGDDLLLGSAIEPDAAVLSLLSQHTSRRDVPPTLTRIDTQTLEMIDSDRHKPTLAGLVGIQHQAGDLLLTTTTEARARRAWAAGLLEENQPRGSAPSRQWTQEELEEPVASFSRAIAWPNEQRIFASYSVFDVFNPQEVHPTPSLLVLREGRIVFASTDLRKRFAPMEKLVIDHPWTLDTGSGRLWFGALPRQDTEQKDAMLLGVDARRLRADQPLTLTGVEKVLAIEPMSDGAVALCRLRAGQLAVTRARMDDRGEIALTIDSLPV